MRKLRLSICPNTDITEQVEQGNNNGLGWLRCFQIGPQIHFQKRLFKIKDCQNDRNQGQKNLHIIN